jgi:hypothetical protein
MVTWDTHRQHPRRSIAVALCEYRADWGAAGFGDVAIWRFDDVVIFNAGPVIEDLACAHIAKSPNHQPNRLASRRHVHDLR